MASFEIVRSIGNIAPLPTPSVRYSADVTLSDGRALMLRTTAGGTLQFGLSLKDVPYSFVACRREGILLFAPEVAEKFAEFIASIDQQEADEKDAHDLERADP